MIRRSDDQSWRGGTTSLVRAFLLIGAIQFIPHSVAASDGVQEHSSRSFVEVSGLLCVQPEGTVDNHYLNGPLGGTSLGMAGLRFQRSGALQHSQPVIEKRRVIS